MIESFKCGPAYFGKFGVNYYVLIYSSPSLEADELKCGGGGLVGIVAAHITAAIHGEGTSCSLCSLELSLSLLNYFFVSNPLL